MSGVITPCYNLVPSTTNHRLNHLTLQMTDRDSDLNLKDEFSGIPLESDPAIFTDLVHALGATALEFQDVLSLNADDLRSGDLALSSPLYAFVLVYNATREYEAGVRAERQQARDQGRGYSGRGDAEPVFWVEQTIKHACGMFAMIHAVANLRRGPDGQDFIGKCCAFKYLAFS